MSQPAKLLVYLEQHRSITRRDAAKIGIMNLWSRIADLSELGWTFKRTWERKDGSRWMRYTLSGRPIRNKGRR